MCTFGDSTRSRDKSNPKHVGEGFCPRTKHAAVHCTRLRLLIKLVWRSEWAAAAQLRSELVSDGVQVATIAEDDDLRELSATNLHGSLRVARLEVHGRRRANNLMKSAVATAQAQDSKLRAAAKHDINAVMERSPRGAIEPVTVGSGDDASVLTDPVDVAVECCEFSARHMSSMQPKWFRKNGVMEGQTVWVASGNRTRRGLVRKVDTDGHCTLQYGGDEHTTSGVHRDAMCLECSSSARPRPSTAAGNGGVDRRAKSNGRTWPVTSRAWRRPQIYLTTLRCSSAAAPRAVPAECVRCLAG